MFLSHNIVFKGKNRAKVMYFMKLAILIFGCPGDMHITNCTRMPLVGCIDGGEKSAQGGNNFIIELYSMNIDQVLSVHAMA